MPKFRGISFKESVDNPRSPQVSRAIDRASATRTMYVNWDDVERFSAEALGYSALGTTDGGLPYISRTAPWAFPVIHPDSGIRKAMFCEQFDYEGIGDPTSGGATRYNGVDEDALARYEQAKCSLRFATPTYEVLGDKEFESIDPTLDESTWRRYVTKLVRPQGEFLSISGTNTGYYASKVFAATGGAFSISTTINKIIAACNYSVTWHQVPGNAIPMAEYNPSNATTTTANTNVNLAIDSCLGRVNGTNFNGMHQWTLLLLAVEIKPLRDVRGTRIYDVTYMFKKFEPGPSYDLGTAFSLPFPALLSYVGIPSRYVANQSRTAYPGHNHVFLPATKLNGATIIGGGGAAQPGWYEVLASQTLAASTAPYTNWIAKTRGVNIYDSANFANLFRPVTWTRDLDAP